MFRYDKIPKELFVKNRKKLAERMDSGSIAVIFSNKQMPKNGDQTFPFRQSSDLFYLTGIAQEKTILLMFPEHPDKTKQEIIFTLKADPKTVIWEGPKLSFEEVAEISGTNNLRSLEEFESTFETLVKEASSIFINLDESLYKMADGQSHGMGFIYEMQKKYPNCSFESLDTIIDELRMIKEPEEIALMETASKITSDAFNKILKNVKPGVKEYEIEAVITNHFIKSGADGHAFLPIVASGKNACYLHYVHNSRVCRAGELLLMDFGAEYACYAGDMSRTIPVNGRYSSRQKEIYNSVLDVFKEVKKDFVVGNTIENIHKKTAKLIEEKCLKLGLFSYKELKVQDKDNPFYKKYFMHGTSHFIGLDVHDKGQKNRKLEKGMVLSCEPGIYIPEEGIGIRIENDILIEEQPIDFMKNTPIEIEEIESLMN